MCNELHVLNLTLKRQELGHALALQDAIANRVQNLNFHPQNLAEWATSFIQNLASVKAQEMRNFEGRNSEILEFANMGQSTIQRASESGAQRQPSSFISRKRPATTILNRSLKGIIIREVEEIQKTIAEEAKLGPTVSLRDSDALEAILELN